MQFVEANFGLPSLGADDTHGGQQDALKDIFDFTQKPRPFVPVDVNFNPPPLGHLRLRLQSTAAANTTFRCLTRAFPRNNEVSERFWLFHAPTRIVEFSAPIDVNPNGIVP